MIDVMLVIIIFCGGFIAAGVCVWIAVRKETGLKTARLLMLAAALLALAQFAFLDWYVKTGNAF